MGAPRNDLELPDYARTLVGMTVTEIELSNGTPVYVKFDSRDTLLEWLERIHSNGVSDGRDGALSTLQIQAREMFRNVFGVELK